MRILSPIIPSVPGTSVRAARPSPVIPLGTLGLLLVCAALVFLTGCTRRFFRTKSDHEVAAVLYDKAIGEWELHDYHIYPHPMARFADPTNPDCPPMPPDDPAAWFMSPKPQRPKAVEYVEGTGYDEILATWDSMNRAELTPDSLSAKYDDSSAGKGRPGDATDPTLSELGHEVINNPCLRPIYPKERQPFLLTLEQAVELATWNSRDYQTRREDLYLAALPVTLERFAFAPQFEAMNTTIRDWAARDSRVGKQNRWSSSSGFGVNHLFSTGAVLLAQVANQTVINLTGNQKHTLSQSTAILDLAQPLLRGGGRAVTLEGLTQSERNLLYNLRDYARFRKDFFVGIAAGAPTLFVRGQTRPIGYYNTLLQGEQVINSQRNVEAFNRLLNFFRAYVEGGGVSNLQVDQVEQNYLAERDNLLQQEAFLGDALDQFKIQLGLPADYPLELDNRLLVPLRKQMESFENIESQFSSAIEELAEMNDPAAGELRPAILRLFTQSELVRGTSFQTGIPPKWDVWRQMGSNPNEAASIFGFLAGFKQNANIFPVPLPLGILTAREQPTLISVQVEKLRGYLAELREHESRFTEQNEPAPPDLIDEIRNTSVQIDLGILESTLRAYEQESWKSAATPQLRESIRLDLRRRITDQFALLMAQARLDRLEEVRQVWPELPPLCLHGIDLLKVDEKLALDLAGRTALVYRLDLRNQRAQLVDAWRQIAVFANSLLGTFDVRYNMEVLTPPIAAQPLNFEGKRSRHQLIFNAQLPLVRKLERNNYRATLIAYQRQRRTLMAAEDQILFEVRQNLRQLRQLAESYEIQRRALELAYLQVDSALETLRAPPAPDERRDSASAAAALTQQLLNAQIRLPRAQDSLFRVWVTYITTRMELYRDLELMQVDSRGVWIDEFDTPDCTPPINFNRDQYGPEYCP